MSVVTSVNTVGSKKLPPLRGALAAEDDLGALLDRVGDVRLDLLDRLHVDQRADHRARLEPVCNLHRAGGLGEAFGEGVVDAVLHQDAVGADAGLAGVALFRGDRALERHLDIGVVEDDERRARCRISKGYESRGPAKAGPFVSILVVVLIRSSCEVHEPVHFGTIGKEPDDIASIVDPVDQSTHHAECWCLRRTGGIELKESPSKEDEPMYIANPIGERADDFTFVIAAEG
jgi:hypothetical protein